MSVLVSILQDFHLLQFLMYSLVSEAKLFPYPMPNLLLQLVVVQSFDYCSMLLFSLLVSSFSVCCLLYVFSLLVFYTMLGWRKIPIISVFRDRNCEVADARSMQWVSKFFSDSQKWHTKHAHALCTRGKKIMHLNSYDLEICNRVHGAFSLQFSANLYNRNGISQAQSSFCCAYVERIILL